MTTRCTFPGRAGDLLWALPTIRAIAATAGPVDLVIAGEFAGLVPLLEIQPYLRHVVADEAWSLSTGWEPPARWQAETDGPVVHLGYRGWPTQPLAQEVYAQAPAGTAPLDLETPWITVPTGQGTPADLVWGWTECWFELKVGLVTLLVDRVWPGGRYRTEIVPPPGRWTTEQPYDPVGWLDAAQAISTARVFCGDCSALHVLAVALGVPAVIVEPMEARWNPIFYPLGMEGPQVTVVKGLDGRPSFDARHTAETLEKVLGTIYLTPTWRSRRLTGSTASSRALRPSGSLTRG